MTQAAARCISALKERHCDFSLLFWLRTVDTLVDTDVGDELSLFLTDMQLTLKDFRRPDFRHDFFTEMRAEFNRTGLDAVSPENFVVEMNAGGKERSIKAAKESKWPRPHQPFCFQTRGDGGTLFFVYQCWQDALRKMLAILKERSCEFRGARVHVGQIYEHCWGERRVSRLLVDWEALSTWFGDKRTPEQIRESALNFPAWFARNLMKHGAIAADSSVKCVIKDKSRPTADGHKISFHFIFDIAGVPRASHRFDQFTLRVQGSGRVTLTKTLEFPVSHLKRAHDAKTFTTLPDDLLSAPWIGIDWRTFAGGHGFSTLFSRKKEDDPNPLLPCYTLVQKDTLERKEFTAWSELPPDPEKLKRKLVLAMLYRASYTTPSADCVEYTPGVMEMAKSGAPGPKPLHRHHCHPKPGPNILPPWFQSAWKENYSVNVTLPCLREGGVLYKSLAEHVKTVDKLLHVQNIPCPVHMYKNKVHVHGSNGIFVAVQGEIMYATCSVCTVDKASKASEVSVIEGTMKEKYQWIIWSEETFKKGLTGGAPLPQITLP